MERYNTALESAGAEHLVIGRLLIERLQAFRAQANQPGYDLVVVQPSTGRSLKIQVKSRVADDSGSFTIGSLDFDFVVLVRLNLGTKKALKEGAAIERSLETKFFVIPRDAIPQRKHGKVKVSRSWLNKHGEEFIDGWNSIKAKLKG